MTWGRLDMFNVNVMAKDRLGRTRLDVNGLSWLVMDVQMEIKMEN